MTNLLGGHLDAVFASAVNVIARTIMVVASRWVDA